MTSPSSNVVNVLDSAVVTANGSFVVRGQRSSSVSLNIRVISVASGNITFTLTDVDPSDETTQNGNSVSTAALSAPGLVLLKLAPLLSPAVKVSWVVSGGANVTVAAAFFDKDAAEIISQEDKTFIVWMFADAIAQNKSMLSLLNTGNKIVRLQEVHIRNVQTSAITGIVAEFRLHRFTGHSSGTTLTPDAHDLNDTLDGGITARSAGTITGEATQYLNRWLWSSDEWGPGAVDNEGADHSVQSTRPMLWQVGPKVKPPVLRTNQGIHLKQITNSTAGTFDVGFLFTQADN